MLALLARDAMREPAPETPTYITFFSWKFYTEPTSPLNLRLLPYLLPTNRLLQIPTPPPLLPLPILLPSRFVVRVLRL